jgi:putative transposase
VNGRKRHLLVDTVGLVLRVVVHPADIGDREGAKQVLAPVPAAYPRLHKLWADQGYTGQLADWVTAHLGLTLELVPRPARHEWVPADGQPTPLAAGFTVQPRRWVVERTFAWLGRYRRMSKDYEFLPVSGEAFIYLAMSRLMLACLVHADAGLPA